MTYEREISLLLITNNRSVELSDATLSNLSRSLTTKHTNHRSQQSGDRKPNPLPRPAAVKPPLNHHQRWEMPRKEPVDRPAAAIICYARRLGFLGFNCLYNREMCARMCRWRPPQPGLMCTRRRFLELSGSLNMAGKR
ncbi:hypothetical protein EVAR_60612_1 [Eumeta japonica]|uniref:Uncharacterized protein n=1 Tax=Eumeta variegata TaxID=151549 RepID=A0A4C1YBL8_EUMVA|nr:hypothetical protein EVAR_60612_1 [Eumeta japonica]